MALTTAQLLADQALWFADFPAENFTVGATTYQCLVPRMDDRNDWQFGGLRDETKVTVILNRNASPAPSAIPPGTIVTFRGGNWRVVSVREDFQQSPLMVELESARLRAEAGAGMVETPGGEAVLTTPAGEEVTVP